MDVVSVEALLCLSEAQLLLRQGSFLHGGSHLCGLIRPMHQCWSFHPPYKQQRTCSPLDPHLVMKKLPSQENHSANLPWDFSFAGVITEPLPCTAGPPSGVPVTTGEVVSLFAEGLLSAEKEALESGTCVVSCCWEFAPLPLSPELVLPVSLFSLGGRPFLFSWGVSVVPSALPTAPRAAYNLVILHTGEVFFAARCRFGALSLRRSFFVGLLAGQSFGSSLRLIDGFYWTCGLIHPSCPAAAAVPGGVNTTLRITRQAGHLKSRFKKTINQGYQSK